MTLPEGSPSFPRHVFLRLPPAAVVPVVPKVDRRSPRGMVKIRLSRTGGKNTPYFRIVVVDERRKSNGRSLELLGTYDPRTAPEKLVIKTERVTAWQALGAQLSPTVKSLMRRARRRQPAAGAR